MFDLSNVKTTVDIDTDNVNIGDYGYFSNDLDSIKRAIESRKTNFKCQYERLSGVLNSNNERRFITVSGYFSLFYPTDKELNINRY